MRKKNLILIVFIIAKFLLQFILINPGYDLHRDEYLHLDQGNHIAWGYVSVPPFTAWISYIIQHLGNSVFWIRFFPALFGALTIVVVWKAIEELKGNLFALILGATCVLFSVLIRLNFLYQPNSLDVLSWTTFYFVLIKYVNTAKAKWLFIGGMVFAVGFLNKYNIVFLCIGLFPAFLLTDQRKIFTQWKLYAALFVGLLMISPNLVWQYRNHFPVLYHLKELAVTQLVNVNRFDFLEEQFFYFIGALPAIVASLYSLLFYRPFKKYRFFFWSIIFTLVVFIYFKAKGYYAIGLYPIYIAFGSVYLGSILQAGRKKYLQPVALAIPVLMYAALFNVIFSIKSPAYVIHHKNIYEKLGLLRWEDGKNHILPQDYADMLGWKELGGKIDSICSRLPNPEHTLILCDNYGQAGAINYYAKNIKTAAISFNADYINWFNPAVKIENFIRVKEAEGSQDELQKTSPFFSVGFVADSITNPLAREYKTTIFVFSNPKINVNQRLMSELENKKKRMMQ